MKFNLNILLLICAFLPHMSISQQKAKDTIKVFYLGGQSNMEGYGYNSDLPPSLKKEFKDVYIFHGNSVSDDKKNGGLGIWETLKPGHGINFSSDATKNNLSNRFGIELSFVKKLKELYPNDQIALIKYARGGTSIDTLAAGRFGSWDADYRGINGINQYDHFLTTIKNALNTKDINGDGREDYLVPSGILWMQGESDAGYNEEVANKYYYNLKRLMELMRANFHSDDLPVVIGKISDSWDDKDGKVWDYCELVQYAQEKYVKHDINAGIIRNTKYYKYSDTWHYDSNGYIDLGERFAEAIYRLSKN